MKILRLLERFQCVLPSRLQRLCDLRPTFSCRSQTDAQLGLLGRVAPAKHNKGLINTRDGTRENTNGDYMEVVIYSRSQKIGRTSTVHGLKVGGRDHLLQAAKNEGLSRGGNILEGDACMRSHLFSSGRSFACAGTVGEQWPRRWQSDWRP
nr:hypothetical protein Iba_chr02bCG14330 [Ipomoea batatas]